MRKPPIYQVPSPLEQSPRPSSAFEDFVLFDAPPSRPSSTLSPSAASSPLSAMGSRAPTLTDILLDISPPPWTLTAFMAYLSQNHCMETLEFTLDLQRYTAVHEQFHSESPSPRDANEQLCVLWDKLMQVYIVPCSPREVNIPSRVRDRLLRLPSRPLPPQPSELEEAGRIIHELMNDSLLVPFLESVSPMQLDSPSEDHARHPKYPSHVHVGRLGGSKRSHSAHAFDSEGMTDDSERDSPSAMEPMTPPTTPPTANDWNFAQSPGGLQRAMAAHKDSWKKVGAKFGFNRKSTIRRSTPTSSSGPHSANEMNRYSNPL